MVISAWSSGSRIKKCVQTRFSSRYRVGTVIELIYTGWRVFRAYSV